MCRTEAWRTAAGSQRLMLSSARGKTITPVTGKQFVTAISGQSHWSLTCAPIASGDSWAARNCRERLVKDCREIFDKVGTHRPAAPQ